MKIEEIYQSCRNCGVFLANLWIDGGWLTMTVTPEKPSLAVANRPHELSEETATRLREIANGTSTIKIELIAVPLWERPDALTPLKDEFKKTT